ncbi:trehalase-like isoform X2 [Ostrea edulis]|uniref:trehalase-like isoform X2 n=1 Tax=Ostrea edulis TaxID=37623 RepID=UPI0024AE897A|nr:trehalase-like isoform X2 [Ostrea edulis]
MVGEFAILLHLVLCFNTIQADYLIPACNSPIFCHGELLDTIQRLRLFPDSKTFVDMSLRESPDAVLSAFNAIPKPMGEAQARKFVADYFSGPGEEFQSWEPEDLPRLPSFVNRIMDPALRDYAWDLCRIWRDLGRKIKSDVNHHQERYSLVYLPHPFIVPGGRFRETYYWDTYWVIKGLLLCEMTDTVKGMLENFVLMIQKFGLIPNGGRIYYTRRSQPPFFIPMMYDYYKATGNLTFIQNNLQAMETEYKFWMANRSVAINHNDIIHVLNRYASPVNSPRPESYAEDLDTVSGANDTISKRQLHKDIVSAAESGWDFSSRWFSREPGANLTLDTIRTTNILPVDLNSILCMSEHILSEFFNLTGNEEKSKEYASKRLKREQAMDALLWNSNRGIWQDLNIAKKSHRDYFYASNLFPLFASCVSGDTPQKEDSVLRYLQTSGVLHYDGGFPTSLDTTGQQWDFPNGWPPLQHVAIWGMHQSQNKEMKKEAFYLAKKWINNNWIAWNRSRNMYEKYSTIKPGKGGGGGEYKVQEGFGWSNGVILDILNEYGDKLFIDQTLSCKSETDGYCPRPCDNKTSDAPTGPILYSAIYYLIYVVIITLSCYQIYE